MNKIKYPAMRDELISCLLKLQSANQKGSENIDKIGQAFDSLIHFMYDDTSLSKDQESMIGWFLLDQHEAFVVGRLVRGMDEFFNKHGLDVDDLLHIRSEQWRNLILVINELLTIMNINGRTSQ